jgi:hypothetical protein
MADLGATSSKYFRRSGAPMLVDKTSEFDLPCGRGEAGVAGLHPATIVRPATDGDGLSKDPTDRSGFTRSRPPIAEAMGLARVCLAASKRAPARTFAKWFRPSVAVLRAMAPTSSSEVTCTTDADETELIRRAGR